MEIDILRLVLAIQAMIAGDPGPLATYQAKSAEYREMVIVEPAETPYWPMHGNVISGDLSGWVQNISRTEGARAYLSLRRVPLFFDRPYSYDDLLDETLGYGPERVSTILCLETGSERSAYWLADNRIGEQRRLSLWRLAEWPDDCPQTGPSPEDAKLALVQALELLSNYTEAVFGADSIWLKNYLVPHQELLQTDGASRTAFEGLVVPGERRMLLEASVTLGLFGGMGSWSDHLPPEGLESQHREALEAWSAARDMAMLSAVNTMVSK